MATLLRIRGGGRRVVAGMLLNSNDPRNSAPLCCRLSAGTPAVWPGYGGERLLATAIRRKTMPVSAMAPETELPVPR